MNKKCSCDKPKVFYITEIAKDKTVSSIELCEDCIQKYVNGDTEVAQEDKQEVISPAEFMKSIFDILNTFAKAAGAPATTKLSSKMPVCPKCGITAEEVQKGGRFGCPECYEHLAPPKLMKYLHGSTKHVGKVPKRWKEEQKKKERQKRREIPIDFRIKGLEIKMNLAAKEEKYELAGQIRDALEELRDIEKDMENVRCSIENATDCGNKEHLATLEALQKELEDRFFEIEEGVIVSEPSQASSEDQ